MVKIKSVSEIFSFFSIYKKIYLLGTALIATLLYKNLADKRNDNSYIQSADEFENLAVQILDKFYQTSRRQCTKALIRQIPAYGNVTWLELAVAAEAKQFIAQKAVQDVLNNIWFVRNFSFKNNSQLIFNIGLVILIKECTFRQFFCLQSCFGIVVFFIMIMN